MVVRVLVHYWPKMCLPESCVFRCARPQCQWWCCILLFLWTLADTVPTNKLPVRYRTGYSPEFLLDLICAGCMLVNRMVYYRWAKLAHTLVHSCGVILEIVTRVTQVASSRWPLFRFAGDDSRRVLWWSAPMRGQSDVRTATKRVYHGPLDKFPARKLQHADVRACLSGSVASSTTCKPVSKEKVQTEHDLQELYSNRAQWPTCYSVATKTASAICSHCSRINAFFCKLSHRMYSLILQFSGASKESDCKRASAHNSFNFQNVHSTPPFILKKEISLQYAVRSFLPKWKGNFSGDRFCIVLAHALVCQR